jgi:beta-lactamase regulating signal transducer with metallopeptidase domain
MNKIIIAIVIIVIVVIAIYMWKRNKENFVLQQYGLIGGLSLLPGLHSMRDDPEPVYSVAATNVIPSAVSKSNTKVLVTKAAGSTAGSVAPAPPLIIADSAGGSPISSSPMGSASSSQSNVSSGTAIDAIRRFRKRRQVGQR